MILNPRIFCFVVAALFAFVGPGLRAADAGDMSSIIPEEAWFSSEDNLSSQLSSEIVANQVRTLIDDGYGIAKIGNYIVKRLHPEGSLSIVVTVDLSGRDFFNHLYILEFENGHITLKQEIYRNLMSIASVSDSLKDLDDDGYPELVLVRYIDGYSGSSPSIVAHEVYRQASGVFVEDTARFSGYVQTAIIPKYEQQLIAIQKELDTNVRQNGDIERREDLEKENDALIGSLKVMREKIGLQ